MAGMYKDAKDWFEQSATKGGLSVDQLVSFILNEVSNDDIERYFGVNMEDDSDNPGAGMKYCSNCQNDVDESDWDEEADMCSDCAAELEEEDEEEQPRVYAWEDDRYIEDPLAWIITKESNGNTIWLRDSDIDYDWEADSDYPPFGL
jgi:hypothetical protein